MFILAEWIIAQKNYPYNKVIYKLSISYNKVIYKLSISHTQAHISIKPRRCFCPFPLIPKNFHHETQLSK